MHDLENSSSSFEIIACEFAEDQAARLSACLQTLEVKTGFSALSDLEAHYKKQLIKVLIIYLSEENIQRSLEQLNRLRSQYPSLAIIIVYKSLSEAGVLSLINQTKAFAIVEIDSNLTEVAKKALQEHKNRFDYQQSLNQLKKQNIKLEELNQNLEQLVHERTKREYAANKQTEVSLKGIQSILSFIKEIARCENIEELMNQVRSEFKKFHALMPPVLILSGSSQGLRVFYFQGKQFTEKKNFKTKDSLFLITDDNQKIRMGLSDLFGRPYGGVSVSDLQFKSSELDNVVAKVIFEHSLQSQDWESFVSFSKERWSLFSMALENVLLKESLQSIAKQWSKTFNEMKDPIVILDQGLNTTLSNSYFHEQVDLDFRKAIDQQSLSRLKLVEETFASGNVLSKDLTIRGRAYRVHSYPIRLIESEIVTHVIHQYVDITQSIDLHSKVVQGEKMAAVGLLAGNIAHELNNPLTGIFSLSQLLLEDFEEGTNTYKDLSEVKGAAARCQRIIKDLLEFSTVGSDSKTKRINLNEMVEKTLPLLKMAMRELNSDIQVLPSPVEVECNPQLLQQVIFNLVNNACQAMEVGGHLTVVVKVVENRAQVIVRDTGSGIPEEIKTLIFDPFFTTKEEGSGTGLGLSMSKTVVERYGGKLLLNDDYKEGTEFIVSLPLVEK